MAVSMGTTGWPGDAQRPVRLARWHRPREARQGQLPPARSGASSRPSSPCPPGAQGWQKGAVFKYNVSAEVNHRAAAPPPLGCTSCGSGHRGRGSSGPNRGGQVPLPPRSSGARAPQPGEAPSATGGSVRRRLYLLSQDPATPAPRCGTG